MSTERRAPEPRQVAPFGTRAYPKEEITALLRDLLVYLPPERRWEAFGNMVVALEASVSFPQPWQQSAVAVAKNMPAIVTHFGLAQTVALIMREEETGGS